MAIVEFIGGRINHRYLMKKTKDDLIGLYFQYGKMVGSASLSIQELNEMFKREICYEILRLIQRLPPEEAAPNE